jgi:hypothetical protein
MISSRDEGMRSYLGRRARWATSVAAFAAVFAGAGAAQAQTVTLRETNVQRDPAATRGAPYQWDINRAECQGDDTFSFPLDFAMYTSDYSFEIWGTTTQSTDCTLQESRTQGSPPPCTKITVANLPQPGIMTYTLTLSAEDIVGLDPDADIKACAATSTTGAAKKVTLYFMLFQSGTYTAGDTWTNTTIDLWGPAAPTNVSVAPDNGALNITSSPPTTDEYDGIVAYCALNGQLIGGGGGSGGSGGGSGGSGGGSGGSGGAGGSGSGSGGGSSADCNTSPFTAGKLPDTSWKPCAEGSVIKDLENDKTYTIAIASKDKRGNIGPLAEIVCGTPIPIDGFFDIYNDLGGAGGGGFCSVSAAGLARGATAGGAGALGALVLAWRRARKRKGGAAREEASR